MLECGCRAAGNQNRRLIFGAIDSVVTSYQVDRNRGYRESEGLGFGPNPWDQGHLARRKSLSWGSEEEARIAERESDMWSNIAPQHENLHDDAWGKIEDWMLKRVENDGYHACVFTGPVFTD